MDDDMGVIIENRQYRVLEKKGEDGRGGKVRAVGHLALAARYQLLQSEQDAEERRNEKSAYGQFPPKQ